MPYPVVLVTGDSISQQSFKIGGYGSALVDMYQGNYDVINRGMGGYNSTQLLLRFREGLDLSSDADVRLIVIHIGTNDCVERGFQKTSAEEYRQNLHAIIDHIRSSYPQAVTVFLTPSTVETQTILNLEKSTGMPEGFMSHRTPERAQELADVCKEVAKEEGIDCIDVFAMHQGKEGIFTDGLHYNEMGYKTKYPQLVPPEFPSAFPMFATYGRDGDDGARRYGKAIEEIGERMRAQAQAGEVSQSAQLLES